MYTSATTAFVGCAAVPDDAGALFDLTLTHNRDSKARITARPKQRGVLVVWPRFGEDETEVDCTTNVRFVVSG